MKPLKIVMYDCWWKEEKDYCLELKKVIQELRVDFPLYYRNRENAVRFNLDKFSPKWTSKIAIDILSYIFKEKELLYCCYGQIGIPYFQLKRYIKEKVFKMNCIEYDSPNNNEDFSYSHNNISFVHVRPNYFQFQEYAKDIANAKGGENYQFLISVQNKIAVHFYDCRGIDVVCVDKNFVLNLKNLFKNIPYE